MARIFKTFIRTHFTILVVLLVCLLFFLSLPYTTVAAEQNGPEIDTISTCTNPAEECNYQELSQGVKFLDKPDSVGDLFSSIFTVVIAISVLLAVIQIAIGGITYMLSDSITNKSSARETITKALLGLIILLAIGVILNTINSNLLNLGIFDRLTPTSAPVFTEEETDENAIDGGVTKGPFDGKFKCNTVRTQLIREIKECGPGSSQCTRGGEEINRQFTFTCAPVSSE